MKTAHYTFTTYENAMASGFDGAGTAHQAVLIREPAPKARPLGGNNVIDLTAWRAANLELPEEPAEEAWAGGDYEEPGLSVPAPRVRKSRRTAFLSELASTACVAAAALAVILRVVAG